MPLHIPRRHINRMFPFEFYDELTDAGFDYYPMSIAFIAKMAGSTADIKTLYNDEQSKDNIIALENQVAQNNIIDDIFDIPLLFLKSVVTKEQVMTMNTESLAEQPMNILAVQYFDTHKRPVFTKEMPIEAIRQIPEILYDDPNLLIAIVKSDDSEIGIVSIPEFLKDKYLDPVKENNKQ